MSRPPIPQGLPSPGRDRIRLPQSGLSNQDTLNRPLPAPPSSLPNDYEIPSLRRKPVPEPPQQGQIGHSRSLSHPFPSFFGGRRQEKKSQQRSTQDEVDSSEDGTNDLKRSGTKSKKAVNPVPHNTPSKQPATGKCMTCDSTVRWPQDLKTFRCTTCLTINDLEAVEAQPLTPSAKASYRRPMPISLDRTKRLIDSSIDDFFQTVLQHDPRSQARAHESDALLLSDEDALVDAAAGHQPSVVTAPSPAPDPSRPRYKDRSPSEPILSRTGSTQIISDMSEQCTPPLRRESSRMDQQSSPSKHIGTMPSYNPNGEIFRSVESYLAGCLTGCTPLNISFFSVKPFVHREDRTPRHRHMRQKPSDVALTPSSEPEAFLSELDAKTLLLGDIGENGSWWTGKIEGHDEPQAEAARDRSPERWRGVVSARTPRINWLELKEWYRLIQHAGDDWRRRWMSLRATLSDPKLEKWSMVSMEALHRNFMESQIHLQRSFLKATENLLKRPRRPLTSPEDCRFLLMLLANPFLSPTVRNSAARNGGDGPAPAQNGMTPTSPSKTNNVPRRTSSGLGRHSGIIKRILGLIANLSNDIHVYLISWFARFSDTHLATMVDLVGKFVTYRLTRQLDKPTHERVDPTAGLIPSFSEDGVRHAHQMHAALGGRSNSTQKQSHDGKPRISVYGEDWETRAAARVMSLLFQANTGHMARRRDTSISPEQRQRSAGSTLR